MLHADAMPQLRTKRYFAGDVSTTHKDLTDSKYRNLRRPKKVTFFCNGDRYFKGKLLFITPHRYLSFQDLLGDLTGKLPTSSSLPYGVRQIYTPSGGHRIRDVENLEDGKEYVCAGFETFKPINYGTSSLATWSNGRPHRHVDNPSTLDLKGISALPNSNHPSLTTPRQFDAFPQRKPLVQPNDAYTLRKEDKRYGTITKPKVITVVRAGRKPYSNIKILLNRRSVQSYERLLLDISESFGPKWKNSKVRSLYTLTGREVMSVSDFFRGDSIFVAVGNEKISFTDVQDIIETLYPESPYAKSLLRNIERQKRKAKQQMLQSLANENQELQEKQEPEKVTGRRSVKSNNNLPKQEVEEAPKKKARRPRHLQPDFNKENEPKIEVEIEKLKRRVIPSIPKHPEPVEEETTVEPPTGTEESDERATPEEPKPQPKTRKQLREEKQRELERQEQLKREAEEKARVELYREIEEKLRQELAEKELEEKRKKESEEKREEKSDQEKPEPEKAEKLEKVEPKKEEKPKPKVRQAKSKAERTVQVEDIKDKYDIGRTLGDGNFALVKMCQHRDTGHQYAMKVIDKAKLKGKEHMIDNEIAIMKACNQENLVKLIEEYETKEEIYIVMELVKGGDLFDAITQSVKFAEPVASKMTLDMTNALFYLHSRGIVHRDLKPENLMVMRNKDESITLKLGDFGLAVEVKAPIFTICGTPTYVAPEILSEVGYGLEVDMWAVGVITYILLCGFPPFRSPDRNQTELFEFIKAGHFEYLSPYWDNTSAESKDLISKLLVVDKKARFKAIDVLCHRWITSAGGSKDLPADLPKYEAELREQIEAKAKENMAEWKANRALVFAHHDSTVNHL